MVQVQLLVRFFLIGLQHNGTKTKLRTSSCRRTLNYCMWEYALLLSATRTITWAASSEVIRILEPRWKSCVVDRHKFCPHKFNKQVSRRFGWNYFVQFFFRPLPLTRRSLREVKVVIRGMLRSNAGWARVQWSFNNRNRQLAYIRPLDHCRRGTIPWQLRSLQTNFPWLLQPWHGCFGMIGRPTFRPHHPETEADRRKAGIKHSHRFHVHFSSKNLLLGFSMFS